MSGFEVKVLHPAVTSRDVRLEGVDAFRVGRDDQCEVQLSSSEVSRFHLRVERKGNQIWVEDQSSNGTTVGTTHLSKTRVRLPNGTSVRIGRYELRVSYRGTHDELKGAPLRRRIHRELLDHLKLDDWDAREIDDPAFRVRVTDAVRRIVSQLFTDGSQPPPGLVSEMVHEVLGLGPLETLIRDPDVSEIMVVDPHTIYVEKRGKIEKTSQRFIDDESCRAVIERIVTPLGRRIDESAPLVDARLPDGSRVNAIIPPLAIRGPCITIRKFSHLPLGMSDLVASGSLSGAMAQFLSRCVRARKNILISGGTGSGKTTLLNVLSASISNDERVVTIEDAAELRLRQPHVVSLESKPTNLEGRGAYTIRDLVKNALRMRPDRIVVGECRAGEAIDMLQAMNTGHQGSMTTTHANTVIEALKRIETLCLMSDVELPARAVRRQLAASVDVVIQQDRLSDGSRKITSIAEVVGLNELDELLVENIFVFRRDGLDSDGHVLGEHAATGRVPAFLADFQQLGLIAQGEALWT